MNNAIINPWWIYIIELLGNINAVSVAVLTFSLAGLLMCFMFYITSWEDDRELYKRGSKMCAIIVAVSFVLITFIPSEETMYTMFAASYITEENVELTGDAIKNAVDYIFEKVDELGE